MLKQYHTLQQLFYQHLYEQQRIHFIFFKDEELTFFETNPVRIYIVLQIFIWAKYHKNWTNLNYLTWQIDSPFVYFSFSFIFLLTQIQKVSLKVDL